MADEKFTNYEYVYKRPLLEGLNYLLMMGEINKYREELMKRK
jgi:hypothetical protein